jgi:acetyl esterase/lipase
VHQGFYSTEQALIQDVLAAVSELQLKYPTYNVRVTGHSLGAAVALLTALDLLQNDIPATMYNIGRCHVIELDKRHHQIWTFNLVYIYADWSFCTTQANPVWVT